MTVKRSLAASALCLAGWCGLAAAQPAAAPQAGEDVIMSKEQGQRLLDSVDAVMSFDSDDTGLTSVAHVKRRLVTRAEVTAYLMKGFKEDENAKRLQRSEIVLKRFGLLSQDFQLQPFLLKLLTEQVAGYYDEKSKTVNLLNWVPASAQEPVLAHELTHALQDKRVNLQTWSNDGFKDVSESAGEDNDRIRGDELETARQAVAEGQAMLVFVDYTAKHPDQQKQAEAGADDSSVMSRAPLLLQKSLEFPYVAGIAFVQALRVAGGKDEAFAHALDQPASSSFEILHPEAYLAHAPVPVLHMPDVHGLLDAAWQPYDVGVMGELDVDMMASLFSGAEAGAALSSAWDGGIYYAAQRKAASTAEKQTSASLGVFYYSQWKSAAAAQAFAQIYAAELPRKDSAVHELSKDETAGEQVYTTREGDVLLALNGKSLFISEGFPLGDARKLRDQVIAVQATGPMRMAASAPQPVRHELSLGLCDALAAHGMMRFALLRGRYTATRNSASAAR